MKKAILNTTLVGLGGTGAFSGGMLLGESMGHEKGIKAASSVKIEVSGNDLLIQDPEGTLEQSEYAKKVEADLGALKHNASYDPYTEVGK